MKGINGQFAVATLSWVREDNVVKVPHPKSNRHVFLSGVSAEVFELIDQGYETDEILQTISNTDGDFTEESLEEILQLLLNLKLIEPVGQFG